MSTRAGVWFRQDLRLTANPTLQSEKFDPDGSYIRKWVNELKDCPVKHIHAPGKWLKQQGRTDYPQPMVDHKQARERVLAAFKSL